MGVETGGCPHTAIREDASMNLAAIEDMNRKFPHAELCFVESGGDNLAATFSPELADLTIYVIDVAEGEKIPRKGGPGITRSDLPNLRPSVSSAVSLFLRLRLCRSGIPSSHFLSGVISGSFVSVSTTITASILAGSVLLAFSSTLCRSPGISAKFCPA